MQKRRNSIRLSFAGNEPPTEFRIFTAGEVVTTKGTFVFDETSAASVMAEYAEHGIDLMIDYDHASLAAMSIDPAQAGKAAGWFNLEVRDGELWAVNVRWTPPAAEALRAKEWRFMSPAFSTDENGRVIDLLNVAITNLPATRQLQPLMAASKGNGMSLEEFMKVCKALGLDLSMSLDDAMAKIKGDAAPESKPEPDAAKPAAAPDAKASEVAPPQAPDEEDSAKVAASLSRFLKLSGKASFVEAMAEALVWRASHLELETERQKLSSERKIVEAAERRKGCADLVVAGRAPATVWADPECSAPKTYLSSMPIADFRVYVADQIKAGGKGKVETPAVIVGSAEHPELTASQLALCSENKINPAEYAAMLNFRKGNV